MMDVDDDDLLSADDKPSTLVKRIAQLEMEQKAARERIEQLTQAKLSVELALARLRTQKEKTEQEKIYSEKLQAELLSLMKRKDDEQGKLKEKIETLQVKSRHDVALLKSERDAALALIEKHKNSPPPQMVLNKSKWLEYVSIAILSMIALFTLIIIILL